MMVKFSKNSKLLVAGLFITLGSYSQTLFPPKIQSPNSSTLGAFGEVPVNLFTGTPDISIPLHTLSYGNINVPISLRYNPSAVKPGQLPGWVGSGWDLQSIGMISRQPRGPIDENYVDDATSGNFRSYYPYPSTSSQANANFGCYYANVSNWYTPAQLKFDFVDHTGSQDIDVQADEFTFNVMGHSGKFYYEGTSGWKVVSDENIKVEMTDFFSPMEVVNGIKDHLSSYLTNSSCVPLSPSYIQSRMFGSFTLTMPDGTKYVFGGRKLGNIPDAVELSSPRSSGTNPSYIDLTFSINTWLLKSITDVYGNTVTFSYASTYPTCNKFFGVSDFAVTVYRTGCSSTFTGGAPFNKNQLAEMMQWPMYLSAIQSPNENITFQMSNASGNRYTINQLSYSNQLNTSSPDIEGVLLGSSCGFSWPSFLNNIQWQQLNTITITDNPNFVGLYTSTPNRIKKYKFNYSNTASQRLMLGSLQYLNKQDNVVGQYQFNYNTDFVTQSPTLYADGNFSDHWGFYNGLDMPSQGAVDFTVYKQSVTSKVTFELLNKITYPTGGYTSFVWEPNDYSQVVKLDRLSLVPWQTYSTLNGYGGGSRIAEIKNILSDGTIATHKKYYYKNGYSSGVTLSSLSSSGVLNGIPNYTFQFSPTLGVLNDLTFGGSSNFLYSTGNYGYTGQGSPIGYKEVSEVNLDGSYTKNIFTNYDADLNNVTHFDQAPLGSLGWNNQYNYFQRSSVESERGKLIGNFIYKPDNTLLQKTIYTYRNDAARFNDYINLIEKTNEYDPDGTGCFGDVLIFTTARKIFKYAYYPTNKTVTTYDQNGGNPIVESTTLGYNANNLVNSRITTTSKSQTVSTSYTYTTEAPASDIVSPLMAAAHIFTPVVTTTATKNNASFKLIQTNYSQPYTGIFVPSSTQIKVGINALETREQVNKYDAKGHVQEVQKANGVKEVYLWGCNSQYILAKIINSDYNTASPLIDQLKLNQAGIGSGGNSYSDADIRTELNKLRTGLPNAMVTTYTYLCGVGMTSETDPAGRTTYYRYDPFNRVSDIRDQDLNILKKFCYNYAGQVEDCSSTGFTNDLQQATFTSTASCPAGSSPATLLYTVPAATYTSFIDKPTANQMAINAMNTNGQAAVNLLPCTVSFNGINTTTMPYNVTLTNTATNVNYSFSVYPSSTPVLLATIPIGTYNLVATPYSSFSASLIINGTTYTNTSFSITSISISTSTTITFQPTAASGPCSFAMSSGFSSPTNSITNNSGVVSFYIVFYSTSSMLAGNSYTVATINGGCRPSVIRTINTTAGGRTWTITIYPSGQMSWQMASGSATLNPNTTVSTLTLSYNL